MSTTTTTNDDIHHEQVSLAYTIVAVIIFVITAYTFLFPLNKFITLGTNTIITFTIVFHILFLLLLDTFLSSKV
jgi:hypothetical protein